MDSIILIKHSLGIYIWEAAVRLKPLVWELAKPITRVAMREKNDVVHVQPKRRQIVLCYPHIHDRIGHFKKHDSYYWLLNNFLGLYTLYFDDLFKDLSSANHGWQNRGTEGGTLTQWLSVSFPDETLQLTLHVTQRSRKVSFHLCIWSCGVLFSWARQQQSALCLFGCFVFFPPQWLRWPLSELN